MRVKSLLLMPARRRPDPITYFSTGRTDYGLRHSLAPVQMKKRSGMRRGAKRSRGYVEGTYWSPGHYRDVMYAKEGGKGFLDTNYDKYAKGYQDNTMSMLLNGVGPGTGTQQRIGRKIYMTGLVLKMQVQANTTASTRPEQFRSTCFSIVYDKRPTGVLPTPLNVWENNDVTAMRSEAGFARFRVLKTWTFNTIGSRNQTDATRPYIYVNKYLRFKKPLVCEFKTSGGSGTSAIGDIQEGALYIIAHTGQVPTTAVNSEAMRLFGTTRLHFTDVMS